MSIYLLLDIICILGPLLLSFDRKVAFYKSWLYALPAIGVSGIFFVVWDIWAVKSGHWSFNPAFVSSFTLFALPVEELLFFLCIPYSALFVYACVERYFTDAELPYHPVPYMAFGGALAVVGIMNMEHHYTLAVFMLTALQLFCVPIFAPVFKRKKFWIAMALLLLLFLAVNGILTSLPVVIYNQDEITGVRIGTIPVEDFVYNFLMISMTVMLFEKLRGRR